MKTPPEQMPLMEAGKLTKQHIGMRIVANMFSEDIKKPKRYGTLLSFDNEGVVGDFGNGKAKIPYGEVDFDYCQDGWMFDVYDSASSGFATDAQRVQARIDSMFEKQGSASNAKSKSKRGRKSAVQPAVQPTAKSAILDVMELKTSASVF